MQKQKTKHLTKEELQAWLLILGYEIVKTINGDYEWITMSDLSDEVMAGYHKTWRAAALDLLAYKGVIDGPTNGKFIPVPTIERHV